MFRNIKTVIFDWDGTLHKSMVIYEKAFIKAYHYLEQFHNYPKKTWKTSEIKQFLGQNPKEMWQSFKPALDQQTIDKVINLISDDMKQSILNKEAILYDGALDVLKYLKSKGYHLIYLSNSKTYYMDLMKQTFDLDLYFDDMICSEMFDYLPKKDILAKVMPKLQKNMVMIGDRSLDIETGKHNRILTIGCTFGYGEIDELNDANLIIEDIRDLLEIL